MAYNNQIDWEHYEEQIICIPIKDYEDYDLYDDGRVYSNKSNKFIKLKVHANKYGYKQIQVRLCKNGKEKLINLARLLMQHFKPDEWNEKLQVDHIDTDPTNNNLNNLRMVTPSQNTQNTKCSSANKLKIKNIRYRKDSNMYSFRKIIDGQCHYKSFKTLEEAIEYKDEYLKNQNNMYIKSN
tara:strand:+ start:99 stop:644 length:546 start_codon:yes stop_codon:yes gene_type:complete